MSVSYKNLALPTARLGLLYGFVVYLLLASLSALLPGLRSHFIISPYYRTAMTISEPGFRSCSPWGGFLVEIRGSALQVSEISAQPALVKVSLQLSYGDHPVHCFRGPALSGEVQLGELGVYA